LFFTLFTRAYARTPKVFSKKICTSAPIRCKLLYDNEIDRCRYGDNSDRYWGFWRSKPHFFEEKTMKKFKNAQNRTEKQPNSPVFHPQISRLRAEMQQKESKIQQKSRKIQRKTQLFSSQLFNMVA